MGLGRTVSNKTLTFTMMACLMYIRENGGRLVRLSGGYWVLPQTAPGRYPNYKSVTVAALVARHLVEYTAWKTGRNGDFPIEATATVRGDMR